MRADTTTYSLHGHRPRCRHVQRRSGELRRQRHPGRVRPPPRPRLAASCAPSPTGRQLDGLGPGEGLRRRVEQHRHPDRDGRQRGADGGPDRRDRRCNEGTDAHLHLHRHRPGRRHRSRSTHRAAGPNGTQVGTGPFNTATARAASTCSFPDGPGHLDGQRARSATPTAPTATPARAVTVTNVKPSITLTRCRRPRTRVTPRPTASPSPTRAGHPHGHHRLWGQRREGHRFRRLRRRRPGGQLPVLLRRRAGHHERDRDGHRLRRCHRHRQPGRRGDGQQRGPDGDPGGGNDLSVDEGSRAHLQLHGQRSGCRHLHRGRRSSCGANGTQVGLDHVQHRHRCGSFVCSLPRRPGHLDGVGPGRGLRRRASNTDTQTVTVANVAPTVTLTGPATADEG